MDVETPIRAGAGAGKILPPDSQTNPRPAVGVDPEERLLRFVDILRAEQVRNAERGKTSFRRWRGPGLLLAVVIIATVAVRVFLPASRPLHLRPDAQPEPAVGTALVHLAPEQAHLSQRDLPPKIAHPQPPEGAAEVDVPTDKPVNLASIHPVREALSRSDPHPSEPVLAEQQVADPPDIAEAATPLAAITTQPTSIDLLALRHEADARASRPTAAAETSEFEEAKPVLWVHYQHGSSHAEANARSLSARIASNLTSSDFEAQTNLPDECSDKVFRGEKPRTCPNDRQVAGRFGL
jgi:hypothetical protein